MAELFRNNADIRPLGAPLRGVGVSQAVDAAVDPGLPRQFLEQTPQEPWAMHFPRIGQNSGLRASMPQAALVASHSSMRPAAPA